MEFMKHAKIHKEILDRLSSVENRPLGRAIAKDRRSALEYLGVRAPELRKIVKRGFSFTDGADAETLAIWDALWNSSPCGEVLFAALEHYRAKLPKGLPQGTWKVLRHWVERIDNWAHCDDLARIYSHLLEADHKAVMPTLIKWNRSELLWHRRISLVSLIHYSGRNAVFLTPEQVLPLVTRCLSGIIGRLEGAVGGLGSLSGSFRGANGGRIGIAVGAIRLRPILPQATGICRSAAQAAS
jgi:hypothetical protein